MARSGAFYGNATGDFLVASGQGGLCGASLFAVGAAATLILRETDGSGRVLAQLSAAANSANHWGMDQPVSYQGKVHATLTGAGASFVLYQE